MTQARHIPVMAAQAADALVTDPEGLYLDCTAGLGGHMLYLLREKLGPRGAVAGIELDPCAAELARKALEPFAGRARVFAASYAEAPQIMRREQVERVDGAFFDFGVSSLQLDTPERGFSFMHDGPLDMRFSPAGKMTAAQIVNTWPPEQLERILRLYGEEPNARRIAQAVARARQAGPLSRTLELAAVVEQASPRRGRVNPATRTFQALRIAVNNELETVRAGLLGASALVRPGGRLAALSFHSLEDRIVKTEFAALEKTGAWRRLCKKPILPDENELRLNPRSRSAKLRAVERIS